MMQEHFRLVCMITTKINGALTTVFFYLSWFAFNIVSQSEEKR